MGRSQDKEERKALIAPNQRHDNGSINGSNDGHKVNLNHDLKKNGDNDDDIIASEHVSSLPWLLVLFVDCLACVGLFFASGIAHESKFLRSEGDDLFNGRVKDWDRGILDAVFFSVARVGVLWLCWFLLDDMAKATKNKVGSVKKTPFVTSLLMALLSTAYFAFRIALMLSPKSKYYEQPSGTYPKVLLWFSLSVSIIELLTSVFVYRRDVRIARETGTSADDGASKKNKGESLSRLITLGKPELPLILAGSFAMVFSSGSNIIMPMYFGKVIDDAVLAAANHTHVQQLNEHILELGIIFLTGAIGSAFRSFFFTLAGQRLVARVRRVLFGIIIKQEVGFFDENRTGELMNRLSSDTAVIQNACTVNVSMLLRNFVSMLGAIVVMFIVSWKLTLVLLAVVPPVAIGAVFYGKRVKKIQKLFQDRLGDAATNAEETISSIRTVRAFANEAKAREEYNHRINQSYEQGIRMSQIQGIFLGFTSFLASGALLLVLWYGATLVSKQSISVGKLTSFMFYSITVAASAGVMTSLYGDFMSALGASVRIFELFDRKPLINITGGSKIADEKFEACMDIANIDFTYPTRPDTNVLTDVSLHVERGTVVALVGPSGGGKSTIVSLLQRLYDPPNGSVKISGEDVKDLDPIWLRTKVSLVSQEPTLFACSIMDNIKYSKQDATFEDVRAAAEKANAHNFIEEFEGETTKEKYETLVGERGVRLSGGQKQRIAIARALICDPQILLLDEATSALDAESEFLVQEAIDRAMEGRTVLVIAHRLSTVRNADKVIVMDGGRIAETGTHDELLVNSFYILNAVSLTFSSILFRLPEVCIRSWLQDSYWVATAYRKKTIVPAQMRIESLDLHIVS
eukprot:m.120376 g.120376  ORF g.120376 m.120376 type:complete len:860 (-) comp14356_c0_seq6:1638-4217(-)